MAWHNLCAGLLDLSITQLRTATLSPHIEQMKEISLVIIPASLSEDRLPELDGAEGCVDKEIVLPVALRKIVCYRR